jgi:hypothetical protein
MEIRPAPQLRQRAVRAVGGIAGPKALDSAFDRR